MIRVFAAVKAAPHAIVPYVSNDATAGIEHMKSDAAFTNDAAADMLHM